MVSCLLLILVPLISGVLTWYLLGGFFTGFLWALAAMIALNLMLITLGVMSNRALIDEWAEAQGLTIVSARSQALSRELYEIPGPPDRSAFEVVALDNEGVTRFFFILVMGHLNCLIDPLMIITERSMLQAEDGRDICLAPPERPKRRKRRKK
jgi:hypothetical protein